MSARELLPAADTPPGVVFVGKVARVNADGTVGVTIDAYGDAHEWPPAVWVAADQIPVRGAVTLVLIDDAGGTWAFPATSMATTHAAGTYAARPAASAALNGVRYFATDKLMEWQCVAGAWVLVSATAPTVTALPASPIEGQRCALQTAAMAALTPPLLWPLVYSLAAGKWMPTGGAPLFAEVDNYTTVPNGGPDRSVSSATYAALAVALTVALPVVGWYDVEIAFSAYHGTASGAWMMSWDTGGRTDAQMDADAIGGQAANVNGDVQRASISRRRQFTTAPTLTAKFRTAAGTAVFRGPKSIKATPLMLG